MFKCSIPDIHLQNGFISAVSLEDKTLDLYMNGKLIKSCVLDDRPRLTESATRIGRIDDRGFIGYISRFAYFSRRLNPVEIYKLYKKGTYTNG